jgi:hypothetical protein
MDYPAILSCRFPVDHMITLRESVTDEQNNQISGITFNMEAFNDNSRKISTLIEISHEIPLGFVKTSNKESHADKFFMIAEGEGTEWEV